MYIHKQLSIPPKASGSLRVSLSCILMKYGI
nr:MAG TPA: hypothetical protein [Caudoviricetes sp.]